MTVSLHGDMRIAGFAIRNIWYARTVCTCA